VRAAQLSGPAEQPGGNHVDQNIGSALALVAVHPTAFAGYKAAGSFKIDLKKRWAGGDIATIRHSPDTISFIQCTVFAYTSGTRIECRGTDESGVSFWCSSSPTYNPYFAEMAANIRSMDGGGTAFNITWDANNHCTEIIIHRGSALYPKTP
jgi:hypothetical protein